MKIALILLGFLTPISAQASSADTDEAIRRGLSVIGDLNRLSPSSPDCPLAADWGNFKPDIGDTPTSAVEWGKSGFRLRGETTIVPRNFAKVRSTTPKSCRPSKRFEMTAVIPDHPGWKEARWTPEAVDEALAYMAEVLGQCNVTVGKIRLISVDTPIEPKVFSELTKPGDVSRSLSELTRRSPIKDNRPILFMVPLMQVFKPGREEKVPISGRAFHIGSSCRANSTCGVLASSYGGFLAEKNLGPDRASVEAHELLHALGRVTDCEGNINSSEGYESYCDLNNGSNIMHYGKGNYIPEQICERMCDTIERYWPKN